MPPRRDSISGRLTEDLPLGYLQGGVGLTYSLKKREKGQPEDRYCHLSQENGSGLTLLREGRLASPPVLACQSGLRRMDRMSGASSDDALLIWSEHVRLVVAVGAGRLAWKKVMVKGKGKVSRGNAALFIKVVETDITICPPSTRFTRSRYLPTGAAGQ